MATRKTLNQDSHKIGRNLRILREEARYSQSELADLLGITHQQIQKYESGTNRLPLQAVPVLCDLLGVPMEAFLDGVGPRKRRRITFPMDVHHISQSMQHMTNKAMRQKIVQIVDILVA